MYILRPAGLLPKLETWVKLARLEIPAARARLLPRDTPRRFRNNMMERIGQGGEAKTLVILSDISCISTGIPAGFVLEARGTRSSL
jgi:hypothetical protein